MLDQFDSLDPQNQFTFTCPLFNAKTKMGQCTQLRDAVYGAKQPGVRRGCQAAIQCGKCPADQMIAKYSYDNSWKNDHHGSMAPKEGKLHAVLLQRIRPVMMRESVLNALNVPSAERMLLDTANERIDQQLKTAPGELRNREVDYGASTKRRSVSRAAPTKPKVNDTIAQAAVSGDLSAAINA